jgi:very-short-patch-repair endonuclease
MNLVVHRSDVSEVTRVRGLPATTVQRTFRDLRRRLVRVEYLVLADAAIRLGLGRFDELAEPAESPMETRLRWLLLEAGLRPQVQTELRVGRADLYFPAARLVIEYDGGNHRDRMVDDDRRQNALIDAGFRILRYTASDVYQKPEVIVMQVRRALA